MKRLSRGKSMSNENLSVLNASNRKSGFGSLPMLPGSTKKSKLPISTRSSFGYNALNLKHRNSSGSASCGLGRSSLAGGGGEVKRVDQRVFDKTHQQRIIRDLLEFLERHGYPYELSVRMLSSPQAKNFINIFEFMYRQIDPEFKIKKIEDDVPKVLKMLGYPCTISRSHLIAVGSPLSWPHLLGALEWLRQLLLYNESITWGDYSIYTFEGTLDLEMVYLKLMSDGYQAEIKESCSFAEVKESIKDALLSEQLQQMNEWENQVKRQNEILVPLQSEGNKVEELQKTLQNVMDDNNKLLKHKSEIEVFCAKRQSTFEQLLEENETLDREIEMMKTELLKLAEDPDGQQLTDEEYEEFVKHYNELCNEVALKQQEVQQIQEEYGQKEINVSKKSVLIARELDEYHQKARACELIPSSCELAGGLDFEIQSGFNENNSTDLPSLKMILSQKLSEVRDQARNIAAMSFSEREENERLIEQDENGSARIENLEKSLQQCKEEYAMKSAAKKQNFEQGELEELQKEKKGAMSVLEDKLQKHKEKAKELEESKKELDKTMKWAEQQIKDNAEAVASCYKEAEQFFDEMDNEILPSSKQTLDMANIIMKDEADLSKKLYDKA